MAGRSWVRKLFARTPRTVRNTAAAGRPGVEALEDRLVPTTFHVTSVLDDGSAGTLRWAVGQANANPGPDSIDFQVSGTVLLSGQLPAFTDAATTTVTAPSGGITLDAHGASSIIFVQRGASVGLTGLTLVHGSSGSQGGGVFNEGTLSLTDCTISGNTAAGFGGGVYNTPSSTLTLASCTVSGNSAYAAGGIWNNGTLTLTNSTLSGNSASLGGGILNFGPLTLTNSTLSGNSATSGSGGGLYNFQGPASLTNCTLSGNSAATSGGGIVNYDTLTLNNSIVANSTGGDIAGSYTGGHNLTGSVALGPLADNGGPTQTMALPAGSPAIGAADPSLAPATDQRGAVRDLQPDIGAYEAVICVTTLTDEDDGSADPSLGTGTSLREAINAANANPGADTITFAVSGTISLDGTALPAITDNLTIVGPGAGRLTIDAHGGSGILQVGAGAGASVSGLTLADGNGGDGGAVLNDGTLALTACDLTGNVAVDGGAIFNDGTLALTGSTLSGNSASTGAAIWNGGTLVVTNSTLSENSAGTGGGVYNVGTLTLTNATVTGNAAGVGGGIFSHSVNPSQPGATTLDNSIVGGNTLPDGTTPSDLAGDAHATPASSHNLIGPGGAGGLANGVHGNVIVTSAAALGLGALGDNGGPTQTVALLPGSPAIDAGDPALAPATDQRGFARGSAPDVGAYEASHLIVVTTTLDQVNGSGTSLRDAINLANSTPGADSITFAVSGTILLNGTQLPAITDALTIAGPAIGVTIDAHSASRIFQVNAGASAALSGLTLAHGSADYGGGIENLGTVTLTGSTLTGNAASHDGGAIHNLGTLTLTNSTLVGNSAGRLGGGIATNGTLTLTNDTLSGNSASAGGGIFNVATLTLNNSIVANSPAGGDLSGAYTGGHNLIGAVALKPLADNGGPTQTMGLPTGSPAIDAADPTLAPATDQRGLARDAQPDIGAFEVVRYTIVVTTLADEDDGSIDPSLGTGTSLREAIEFANKNPAPDTITFAVSGTINLDGTQLPTITDDLTIDAPATGLTIDAGGASRIFQVNGGSTVSLSGLTLAHGSADNGGAIFNAGTLTVTGSTLSDNTASTDGGAIDNTGALTLTNSTLTGDTAGRDGGAVYNYFGGTATLTGSTLADNNAGRGGGGIRNGGSVSLTNSTLAGNAASSYGGGIASFGGLTVTNSTLSGNSSVRGGGIYSRVSLSLNNSIVANSPSGGDLYGIFGLSGGHNLTGSVALGPLADNGGPTQTMALPFGSPAIDAADPALAPATDQRGSARDLQPDIGAYEAGLVVTTLADEDDGSTDPSLGTGTSLREAINYANAHPGPDRITFAVSGTISLDGTQLPAITDALTEIVAPAAGLTIDAHGASRIFQVNTGATVNASGLTLANGSAGDGGAVLNAGTLTLTDSTLIGNAATADGGAIDNTGTLTLTNGTLSGNSAASGGAISSSGVLTMTDSTLDGNSASGNGGAIAGSGTLSLTHVTLAGNSASGSGGAITSSGTLTVSASTLSGNAAGVDGGGIWNNSTLAVTNSTLSGNSAAGDGGGVYSGGTLTLVNATLFGNSAVGDGGGVYNAGSLTLTSATLTGNAAAAGGGVFTRMAASTELDDTIVGGNTLADGATPSDLAGGPASGGHNLFGPGGSGGLANGVDGNIVVATAADLHLGPLAGNDGRTQTVALLPGSPAIDAGDPTLAPATDQRGLPRDARPDIGAFEVVHHLVVTTLADEDDGVADIGLGTGTSLREAIEFANQDPGPDTITFAVSGTILLDGTQLPTITDDLTITGPASGLTIDANGASRILQVNAGTTVGLSGLTLAHGSADFGGAIRNYGTLSLTSSALNGNAASHDGAGIWNGGTLAVTGSTLAGNSAAGSGGGIANIGALTLTNSTLSGNSASLGGGIINYHGTASLTDSTLAGNSVSNSGGGIWNAGTLSLTNSTLSGNSASANTGGGGGGGIWNAGLLSLASSTVSGNYGRFAAGGLVNTGTASVTNSTLYGNSSGEAGGIWNLGGLSITNSTLSGNAGQAGPGGIDNTPRLGLNTLTMNNSIVANNSTNQFSYTDPNMTGYYTGGHNLIGVLPLGPLADNGGPTRTMALPAGSPAIDAADPALAPATDQRGFYRNTSPPDIGAYEAGNLVLVTTLADEDDGSADPSLGTGTSLREAINFVDAHPGADHVTIEFAVSGTISLDGTALPAITDAVTVTAPAAGLTIDAHGASGILQVNAGATVSVSGVTFANGSADDGAAVLNYGSLTLDAATFTGNSAGHDGGAVHNDGTLTLTNSTLAGNSAGHDGGGVWNDGVLTVTGSTFADNSGLDGAGVYNDGTLTLTNSTLAGNSAGTSGGGVWNGGTLTVTYSTLSGNAAGGSGGGIAGSTAFSLNDSIVANSTSGGDIAGSYTGGHNLTGAVALGPLADNGGPTQTMALPAGSPAIDAADLAFPITVDQRGAVRDSHPDIGAYEAVIVVTTLADEDDGSIDPSLGTGTSLREAINYANAHPGADSITFAVSGTISLDGTQLPAITDALTITGPGAGLTIDAHGASGILQVSAGATVRLDRLSLAHGSAADGGAIHNDGVLAVSNSTLAGNSAGTDGGGVWNDGTLAVTDSTLADNSAAGSGGGVYNAGSLTLTSATLTGNAAAAGGGVFTRTAASTELDDSIVGGNTLANGATPSDLAGGPASGGHNLIGPGGSGGLVGGVDGNIVVATAADLHLGSLANNSGPTQTVALLPGSPAIDAGDDSLALGPSGVPLTADQRGAPRVANGTVDIGAFEVVAPIVVTTLADEDDGSADPGLGTGTSLREAIEFANQDPGPNTIIFAVSGTISLDGTQLPTITDDLTITGPASGLTIDAHGASRILQVSAGTAVGLSGLTLAHGSAYDGAAILNNGTLAVTSSALTGNAVSHDGGAIWNGGTLTLTGSTLAGNSAARLGGGIANVGTLTLTKTTLSGNTASSGGGIFDSFGTVTATDSTLAGNSVGGDGGGINNGFGKVSLTNSTLSGNSSGGSGGGIFNDGGLYGGGWLSMTNCTISINSGFAGGGL